MPISPIAPGALTGTPVFRLYLPTGIPNASTGTISEGENAWGKTDAQDAALDGFVRTWAAESGSAASSGLSAGAGGGLVLDSVGGLCLGVGITSSSAGTGHVLSGVGSITGTSRTMTVVLVGSAPATNILSSAFDASTQRRVMWQCTNFGTGSIQIGIDKYRRWTVWTSGGTLGTNTYTSTRRAMASTQVVIVRFGTGSVRIQVFAAEALTSTTSNSFAALANLTSMTTMFVGNTDAGGQHWHGPIRGLCQVMQDVSDAQAPGLCQHMLNQCGLGMGTTLETEALTLVGDSWFAGFGPSGLGTVAAFLAEAFAGKIAVDTVAVGGATASWWETGTRLEDLAAIGERFPGHTISKHTFVNMLGINDSGLAGGAGVVRATFNASMIAVETRLTAIAGSKFFTCTVPPAANSSWAVPGNNSVKNNSDDGIKGYNAAIRLRVPANRLIDFAAIGSFAVPPCLSNGDWTEALLQKLTTGPLYQIAGANSSTRLTFDCLHVGREGHSAMAREMVRRLANAGVVPGEGSNAGGAGGTVGYSRLGRD